MPNDTIPCPPPSVGHDEITQVDVLARRVARALREPTPRITRAQAFYAVLWMGYDPKTVRTWL
ncbi:MAG: hypothetical protein IPP12_22360 [Nitrospira sp.]|nr:hypothetical protein [Nitrospira sp.]